MEMKNIAEWIGQLGVYGCFVFISILGVQVTLVAFLSSSIPLLDIIGSIIVCTVLGYFVFSKRSR